MAVFLGKKPIWPQPFPTLRDYQLYGHHRARRLSARQRAALDEFLPHFALPVKDVSENELDPQDFFKFPVKDIWLEIGFGAGEHLLRMMRRHPDIGFIGCEAYLSGMARFVAQLDPLHHDKGDKDRGDRNIRLYHGDARDILFKLAPQKIGRLFLLYPDPWPKTRHWARRFIQSDIIRRCAQLMKPGAQIHFASDDPVLTAWVLSHIIADPDFYWHEGANVCRNPYFLEQFSEQEQPLTRYEAKAIKQNRHPSRLVFCRHQ